ncbi:hypothetical protein B484DRAFT_399690 [Ochromonadaceae sp. CCMP2298]|nr:hypothetical protein B484DRAFT_399690 [Ochromonadaceae sp. CCMP2298]
MDAAAEERKVAQMRRKEQRDRMSRLSTARKRDRPSPLAAPKLRGFGYGRRGNGNANATGGTLSAGGTGSHGDPCHMHPTHISGGSGGSGGSGDSGDSGDSPASIGEDDGDEGEEGEREGEGGMGEGTEESGATAAWRAVADAGVDVDALRSLLASIESQYRDFQRTRQQVEGLLRGARAERGRVYEASVAFVRASQA